MPAPTEEEMIAGMHKAVSGVETVPVTKPILETPDDKKRLRSLVDRIVRLEEEKKGLADDIKSIYAEAKSAGYSKRALRIVVKREMEDADQRADREDAEAQAELMMSALGDFVSSPLGEAAVTRAKH